MRLSHLPQYILTAMVLFDGVLFYLKHRHHLILIPMAGSMLFFSFLVLAALPGVMVWMGEKPGRFQLLALFSTIQALLAIVLMNFLRG
jgi:hypothetical protein